MDRDSIERRELLRTLAGSAVAALVPAGLLSGRAAVARTDNGSTKALRVWVFSDAHVARDKQHGVESLARALRQSESASGFDWDIALDLGDLCGDLGLPKDAEGAEIVRQFGVLKKHRREQVYDLSGNHDRSGLGEPQAWWWRKWVDPTGEHRELSQVDSAQRPFPVDGTWERYSFRVGNLLFLMMSDINEPTQRVGRGGHYVQAEHADDVEPPNRRVLRGIFGNGAYVEGWAEYIADVMTEEGYLDHSPKFGLVRRKILLRAVSNSILDIRLQTMNMTDQQAMDLMLNDTFQTQAEAEGKLRRAKLTSTQLPTYFVGIRQWWELRKKYQAAKGSAFNLEEFHNKALDQGPLPIEYLEKIILPGM
jgi:Bacterial protein of unknown function (DUF885)